MPTDGKELLEEATSYVEEHKVFQLFESLLSKLLIKKDPEPIDYLITLLKRESKPHVIIAGPPGAQTTSVCELIAVKKNLVHVNVKFGLEKIAKELVDLQLLPQSALDDVKALKGQNKPVPDELMVRIIKEKLNSGECISKGWVLEDFPSTAAQARAMQREGLLATRFIQIAVSDAEVVRRGFAESELVSYRQAMAGVLPLYKKVLKELDGSVAGDKGVDRMLDAALPLLSTELPSQAPRGCARVLLLGGPGSQAEELGAALAQQYGVKLLSAIDLLHGAAITGQSKEAQKAMATSNPLAMVSDDLVGKLILSRLNDEDVRTSGFVMVGYPATASQATLLKRNKVWLRHVVHLDLPAKAAEAAVTGQLFDPWDGEMYHKDGKMPTDPDTQARLVPHPKNSKTVVKDALKRWGAAKPALLKAYGATVTTEDATRPQRELIERLAPCFLAL